MSTLLWATAENPVNLAPLMYAFVIILAVICALIGYSRGVMRQLVRTITVLISIIVSYSVIAYTYHHLDLFLADKTMGDVHAWLVHFRVIAENTDVSWLYNIDMDTLRRVLAIPFSLVVMPVMFSVILLFMSGITYIFHKIISALCGFTKNRNNLATRFFGLILGGVQGFVLSILFLLPIIGVGTLTRNALDTMKTYAPEDEFTLLCEEKYNAYFKSISENPLTVVCSYVGGNFLYENIATVNIDGSEINTTELVPDAVKIACEVARLNGADFKNLTQDNETAIDNILTALNENRYFRSILAGAVSSVSQFYSDGQFTVNIGEPFDAVIDSAAEIFHTSTPENIASDLGTLKDVYYILSADGVLIAFDQGSEQMLNVLTSKDESGETTVSRVVSKIRSNERTKPLVTLITKLSVTVMADGAGIDDEALQTYDNIKNDVNTQILTIDKDAYETEEEYVAEVSNALDTTLKNNNINLEKDIVDTMAQYVSDNFSDVDELTEDQANDLILSYYDAYLKYLETGTIPQL